MNNYLRGFPLNNYIEQYRVFSQLRNVKHFHKCTSEESFVYWQISKCVNMIRQTIKSIELGELDMAQELHYTSLSILHGIKRDWEILKAVNHNKSRNKKK